MKHIFCNISFENIKKNQMHGKFKIKIHKLYSFPMIRIRLEDCYKNQNNDKIHNYTQFNKNLVLITVSFIFKYCTSSSCCFCNIISNNT